MRQQRRTRQKLRKRYQADITQHDGTQDASGNPTYTTAGDWDTVVSGWPCDILTTTGGESIRGRQVAATTTHVLFGEYQGVSTIGPGMKATIGSIEYGIVAAYDVDGTRREMRVECRREL